MRVFPIIGTLGLLVALVAPLAAQEVMAEELETEARTPIGLVLNPVAYPIPEGVWLIGAGTFRATVPLGPDDRQYSLGVYRGLAGDVHIGAFWIGVDRDNGGFDNFFGGAAHWQFLRESRSAPALAIGGYAYGGDGSGGSAYAVASKNLMNETRPGAVILHGGVRWDTFDNDFSDDDVAPFVGANLILTPRVSLNAEWRDNFEWETDDVTAFGASFLVSDQVVLSAGVQDQGNGDDQLYVAVSVVP